MNSIDGLTCTTPAAAFYLMAKADGPGPMNDERFVMDMLETTGVLVVPGSGFGTEAREGYFRMVYLADEQVLGKVFGLLAGFMSERSPAIRYMHPEHL